MAITPKSMIEDLSMEILRIYEKSETAILEEIAGRMKRGLSATDWEHQKLLELRQAQDRIKAIINGLRPKTHAELNKAFETAYKRGIQAVNSELRITTALTGIDTFKIQALAQATLENLDNLVVPILRSSNDIYRRTITESVQLMTTGTYTRVQATQKALERFADQGVSAFIDKAGRRWTMPSYARMATRTGLVQANTQGTIDRMEDLDHNLVYVSEHPGECPVCRPWEGRILKTSSNAPGNYPTVEEARIAGLFHPNCGHSMSIYLPGFTKPPKKKSDPELYDMLQKENYYRRGVRQWEKRQAVAIDPSYEKFAKEKVKQWKNALKEQQAALKARGM